MVRAVLDVNVLVSAAIGPLGIPRWLWLAWLAGRFTLISSDHILATTIAKLRLPRIARRYRLTERDVQTVASLIRARAAVVLLLPEDVVAVTDDPEDDAVLATAQLGRADYLVTGDHGLLALRAHEGARIVSPREFAELLEVGR